MIDRYWVPWVPPFENINYILTGGSRETLTQCLFHPSCPAPSCFLP